MTLFDGKKIAERPASPSDWRKIIDSYALWAPEGADEYNVSADRLSALIAFHFAASPPSRVLQDEGVVAVKPLEWQAVQDQIPKHAFAAYTPFSRWLIVCEFLSMNHMVYRFDGTDYETLDAAKAAAQSDYDARIRSAILPSTIGGSVGVSEEMVERAVAWDISEGMGEPLARIYIDP